MFRTFARAALAAFTLAVLASAPVLAQNGAAQPETEITLGDLTISHAFTRATLPNAPVAGGFLTISNNGGEADRLVAVSVPFAKEGQIHEMAMEGDVMKMRRLPDGIAIPAGGQVTLEPGGLHLMFMGLTAPLVEGEKAPVTLTFEKAGTITLDFAIAAAAAAAHH
ncbi:MAG: hypothetical protein ABS75_16785 [Pelagibacterium sp. SCN 63-23]|nr:MAG: hypothetical protein ABS75_16785 [Pelagibacterium sp. SCN 63-23]